MLRSQIDTEIGTEEYDLMVDQDHFEKVWAVINTRLNDYVPQYLDEFNHNFAALKIKNIINNHEELKKKYIDIFTPELMEEYEEDLDGFKGSILSKKCQVILRTLNSKSEALADWKRNYIRTPAQKLYDTFYNMIQYAEEYNMQGEDVIDSMNSIEDIGFSNMQDNACYLQAVIGTGILSTVLNAIYPRVFPNSFKIGMFALFVLSDKGPIDMKSESSEFIMVKDDIVSKTGTIETEHNYFYPYETFGLYSLRIYRVLDQSMLDNFNIKFPDDYRYALTNDFYAYVTEKNRQDIQTLLGNDDILKYGYSV